MTTVPKRPFRKPLFRKYGYGKNHCRHRHPYICNVKSYFCTPMREEYLRHGVVLIHSLLCLPVRLTYNNVRSLNDVIVFPSFISAAIGIYLHA